MVILSQKEHIPLTRGRPGGKTMRFQNFKKPKTLNIALGVSLDPSEPQFPHPKNGDGNSTGLTGSNEISNVKAMEIFITHLSGAYLSHEKIKLVAL